MKKPPINLYEKQLIPWLGKHAFLRKFKRYWGTTDVNGVEVLALKAKVHPSLSSKTRKLLKMLQVLDQVTSQRYKGIRSAWLYLNPDKAEDIPVNAQAIKENVDAYIAELIAQASEHNAPIPEDYLHTFSVKVVSNTDYFYPIVTPANVVDYLQTHQIQFDNVFAFIQLLLTPVSFTSNSTGRIEVSRYDPISGEMFTTYMPVTVCTYQLPAKDFNADSIATKLKEFLDLSITGRRNIGNVSNHDLNMLNIRRNASSIRSTDRTSNSVWYVHDHSTYLRASFLEDTTYSLDTRIETIVKALDFDYKKKSASIWTKIVVFAILVVAVVLAPTTGGGSLAAAATIVITVSIALTITTLLLESMGNEGGVNFARSLSKTISPFVQIAQLVLLINSAIKFAKGAIAAAGKQGLTEVGKQVATEATSAQAVAVASQQAAASATTAVASQQATTEVVTEAATAAEQASKSSLDRIVDYLLSKVDTRFVLKTLEYTTDLWSRNKLQEAKQENKKLAEEAAELEEGSKQNDLAQQFMDMHTKPLRMDWSEYAERYDRPYEPTLPKFHIGNVQATTVTAFNRIS